MSGSNLNFSGSTAGQGGGDRLGPAHGRIEKENRTGYAYGSLIDHEAFDPLEGPLAGYMGERVEDNATAEDVDFIDNDVRQPSRLAYMQQDALYAHTEARNLTGFDPIDNAGMGHTNAVLQHGSIGLGISNRENELEQDLFNAIAASVGAPTNAIVPRMEPHFDVSGDHFFPGGVPLDLSVNNLNAPEVDLTSAGNDNFSLRSTRILRMRGAEVKISERISRGTRN